METRIVLEHCKFAILNFLCVYGILDFSTKHNKQTRLHFILTKQYALWAYLCYNFHQSDTQLVMETRLLLEQ